MSQLFLDNIPIQQQIRGNCDNTLTAGAIRRARIIRLMKILISDTWNPTGYAHLCARSSSTPFTLPRRIPCRIPIEAIIIPGITRLRAASKTRNVFSGRQPQSTVTEFTLIWLPSFPRSNALEIPLLPHGNTLDRAESRLSVWLPRIMDVTVTHVNEACHLHLLRLRRTSPTL